MKDLLKEAIADAKAVRETAMANAKLALEEAFTPRLQSMLSAKLSEEMEEETPEDEEEVVDTTEGTEEEMPEVEADDTASEDEMPEDETEDDDLDLEEIIRELEEEDDMDSEMSDDDVDLEEIMRSLSEEDEDMSSEDDMTEGEDTDEDEDVDINELLSSLREEEGEEAEEAEDTSKAEEDLEEAYNVIRFLKGKINEVNLLNAKLLYSNKLFRNFSLNESQKMKIIENFDRASNLREIKLVYSTLAEGFKMPGAKKIVKESFASKPIASTKPAKSVISEGTELSNRFRKLAGLIK